jgi:predicted dehydrogenase
LVVGIEYHKRFDDRNLIARRRYRSGLMGEFRLGQARLHEPWYYHHSNFQNWCTAENSDMFTYVACHYIDAVHFITGLLPVRISVYGQKEKYPNGKDGFLYTDGRVIWENGACLNVQNSMAYPDIAPGGNSQGIMMLMAGGRDGGHLDHFDSFRGVKHSYISKDDSPGSTFYNEINPDYFQMVPAEGGTLRPVGYGFRSIEFIIQNIVRANTASASLAEKPALEKRQEIIKAIDQDGIIATPANSSYNELVMEAGRLSITNDGREVMIEYGDQAGVKFR